MEENKKLSYEQLEQMATQLSQQNRKMFAELQALNQSNALVRLDYLFRVIELAAKHSIFPEEFVRNCIKEFVESITIPKEESEEESTDTPVETKVETPIIDLTTGVTK